MRRRLDRLKLELGRARRPALLVVGVVASAVVVVALLVSQMNYDNPLKDKLTVWATFDDVKGSSPGRQPIYISGVKVGVVTDWKVVDNRRAALELSIEDTYAPLYRDAEVRLRPVTPLQDMYLDVSRGTPAAGRLEDGATIAARQTVTPVDISRVMNTFDAPTRRRLKPLLAEMGRGLAGRGDQLHAAFARLAPFLRTTQQVTTAMARHRRDLAQLTHTLGTLTGVLGARSGQLRRLVRNGQQTLAELARRDGPLAATIEQLAPALQTIRSSFAQVRAATTDIDPAADALQTIAAPLPEGLEALARFSTEATPALRALRRPLLRMHPLVQELRPTTDALQSAFTELRPQAGRVDTLTSYIAGCRPEMNAFFHNTISVFKFGDVHGAFPRADAVAGADSIGRNVADGELRRIPDCSTGIPNATRTGSTR